VKNWKLVLGMLYAQWDIHATVVLHVVCGYSNYIAFSRFV